MLNNLIDIKKKYENLINSRNCVFKKCKSCIVILEKLNDTITNESRGDIFDDKCAQFRANKLLVLKIFNIVSLTELASIDNSIYPSKQIKYLVGNVIEEKNFNTDLNKIHTEGIHYYKTIEPAYYKNLQLNDYTGKYYEWHENGAKKLECEYFAGNLSGMYAKWFSNGKKLELCEYVDGKLHGRFQEWSINGVIYIDERLYNDVV